MTDHGGVDLSLIDPIFEQYREQPGKLIPILQKTQATYGWLPGEALELIADRLDTALSKVYGVATFYSQFYLEPRGKHELYLCDGTACHVKGTSRLAKAVRDEFGISPGDTTSDGELTLELVYCMGSCALAPVAVLDGEVMGRMEPGKLTRRIKKRLATAKETETAA
ncbi:MAG: NAD(P)H-dependent oxidoreductase subunit E [Anaerolineae bacterium]